MLLNSTDNNRRKQPSQAYKLTGSNPIYSYYQKFAGTLIYLLKTHIVRIQEKNYNRPSILCAKILQTRQAQDGGANQSVGSTTFTLFPLRLIS